MPWYNKQTNSSPHVTFDISLIQIRVVSQDSGNPPRSATAIVYVTVLRNFFAPTWQQSNYQERLQETQAPGVPFTTVQATDRDGPGPNSQISYYALGNQLALDYFQVDPVTGEVSVSQSLLTDPEATITYRVNMLI
jgi:hypothetical protein